MKSMCYNCRYFKKANPKGDGLEKYPGCSALEDLACEDVSCGAVTCIILPELVKRCLYYDARK